MEYGGNNKSSQFTAGAETIVYQLVDNKLDKDLPLEWNRLTNRFLTTPKKMIVHDVHISVQQLVRNGFLEKVRKRFAVNFR